MVKDLLIGVGVNYDWDVLKYWSSSIRETNFSGDVVLLGSNLSKRTIDKLKEKKITYVSYTPDGNIFPYVERFYHIWKYLVKHGSKYDYVITTDTRDVYFQKNPFEWLHQNNPKLVCSSEGMKYKDEPWNITNALETFGPLFLDQFSDKLIYNVGVIGGKTEYVRSLILSIYQMSINRPVPIVDQAVFNFLINNWPDKSDLTLTNNSDSWAIQLGVTLEAVKSLSGHVGQKYGKTPRGLTQYKKDFADKQPNFLDGKVLNCKKEEYAIVHQWNRVNSLYSEIIEKY